MSQELVVFGSRHGGTRGIAERIGEVLRIEGVGGVSDHLMRAESTDA